MEPQVLDWRVLRENYIKAGVPVEQPILVDPDLRLIYDPDPPRLGLRLRVAAGRTWSAEGALRNITARTVQLDGGRHVEVFTDDVDLFRAIYALIKDMLSRLRDGEQDGLRALQASLAGFQDLVAKSNQLSREQAIGLYGELLVLERLLARGGIPSNCWIGTERESHDFRLGQLELEVKTTAGNVREHQIHGLNQLTPTPGHSLFLVSVRLGHPGSGHGRSLKDLVDAIRGTLEDDRLTEFNRSLAEFAYDSDHSECSVRYQLSAPVMAVLIGKDFPAISHAWLSKSLKREAAARIRDVRLTLNLEGLGAEFDELQFAGYPA